MDKQKEIDKMAYSICPMPQDSEYITDCTKCGSNGDCLRQKHAKKFIDKGYGDIKAAVKELSNKILSKGRITFCGANGKEYLEISMEDFERLVKEVCGDD